MTADRSDAGGHVDAERPDATRLVRRLLTPRYVAFPLANLLLYVVVLVAMQEVVVRPGQGGRIDVFLWPSYWTSYHLQDVPSGAVAEFEMQALLVNHAIGLLPCYLAATVAVNASFPASVREWRPNVAGRYLLLSIVGGFVAFTVAFFVAFIMGFEGILLWLSVLVTCVYTAVHAIFASDDGSDESESSRERSPE